MWISGIIYVAPILRKFKETGGIRVAEHKRPPYLCFADFEFTCGGGVSRTGCEMLSVGVIVCDRSYKIIDTFYSTSRPARIHKMSRQCRELTHLTQAEINSSPDSNDVLRSVKTMLKKYGISSIYVWGNFDRPGLISDMNAHVIVHKNSDYIQTISAEIRDIQDQVTRKMQLPQAVSIEELAPVCGYTPDDGHFHNAYIDAMALYHIHKAAYTTDIQSCDEFIRLKKERVDKLEARRHAEEERRLQLAFSVTLTPREREYFDAVSSMNDDKLKKEYTKLRYNIIKAMNKYPDENEFYMVVFVFPNSIKVIPECNYDPARGSGARHTVNFSRLSFGDALMDLCEKYHDPLKK